MLTRALASPSIIETAILGDFVGELHGLTVGCVWATEGEHFRKPCFFHGSEIPTVHHILKELNTGNLGSPCSVPGPLSPRP